MSLSVYNGVGAGLAVLGVILLLVAICLTIGAEKVSDTSRYQDYDLSPRNNVYCDNIVKPPVPGSTPRTGLLEMYVFNLKLIYIFIKVRTGKSTSVLPNLRIPASESPLSNRCCSCAA